MCKISNKLEGCERQTISQDVNSEVKLNGETVGVIPCRYLENNSLVREIQRKKWTTLTLSVPDLIANSPYWLLSIQFWVLTGDSKRHLRVDEFPNSYPLSVRNCIDIVRRINISISALPRSCLEIYFTDRLVFLFCQLKLSASGKMAPCENVKIDWGLNAVRIHFPNTWLISC